MHPSNIVKTNELSGWKKDDTEPSTVDNTIIERGERYGCFKDGASVMQTLKSIVHDEVGWKNLNSSQREAMDMILHKIGRIVNGDPDYDDSWHDIAGYATLIVKQLNGENP